MTPKHLFGITFALSFLSLSLASLTQLQQLNLGGRPQGSQIVGNTLYVALTRSSEIAKIENYLGTPNITSISLEGCGPTDLTPLSQASNFLVSCSSQNRVLSVNMETGTISSRWNVGGGPSFFSKSVSNTVYIPAEFDNLLTAIDIRSQTLGRSFRTGNTPYPSDVNRLGREAYVPNSKEDSVSVINLVNGLDTKITLPAGSSPRWVALIGGDNSLLVSGAGLDQIYFLNLTSSSIEKTLTGETGSFPFSIALSPQGTLAFVGSSGSDVIETLSTITKEVVDRTKMGGRPGPIRTFGDLLVVSSEVEGLVSIFRITE